MSTKATSNCTTESWNEDTYHAVDDGGMLTRAHAKQTISGDIEGQGDVQWSMCYRPDGTADFVGLQHVTGRLASIQARWCSRPAGHSTANEPQAHCASVPGSGTDDLSGISGGGELQAARGDQASIMLTYRFE